MNSNPQDSALTCRVRIKSFTKSNDPITLPKPENTKLCCKQDYKQFIGSKKSSINEFTVTREQLPAWYGSSEYILHGYRRVTNSFRGCILSLFYLHNETGNVYTHLIGFIIVVQYSYYLLFQTLHTVDSTTLYDYLAHLAFMAGLMGCLALSTIFHLCCCHSRVVSASCNKADYVGIVALQVGSIIPILYYGFYCDPFYQLSYMIIFVILGIITVLSN
jgi:adiponectin receptor